jgi:hypothetical protein
VRDIDDRSSLRGEPGVDGLGIQGRSRDRLKHGLNGSLTNITIRTELLLFDSFLM